VATCLECKERDFNEYLPSFPCSLSSEPRAREQSRVATAAGMAVTLSPSKELQGMEVSVRRLPPMLSGCAPRVLTKYYAMLAAQSSLEAFAAE
jgi:hypothetical protein